MCQAMLNSATFGLLLTAALSWRTPMGKAAEKEISLSTPFTDFYSFLFLGYGDGMILCLDCIYYEL